MSTILDFQPAQLIQKKRDGGQFTQKELEFLVRGFSKGTIPDYQIAAFLMAVYFKGMTHAETADFTEQMFLSGERFTYPEFSKNIVVDKHSTGGLGDKVSMILAPLAAECGLIVPMMAGRALGHTGGTIDKLESIPGFRVQLTHREVKETLKKAGCAIFAQSEWIAPADRKLYALRDVTATVECEALIIGSILSKKIAAGTQSLVLDVKVGSGAFMKTKEAAKKLAKSMKKVGSQLNYPIRAILSQMDQPLGSKVGNSIEMLECIQLLKTGKGASDLKELTIHLTAEMLLLAKIKNLSTLAAARKLAREKLESGKCFERFCLMVEAQGGKRDAIENPEKYLTLAPQKVICKSPVTGYVTSMDCESIGRLLIDWGGGRKIATDAVDLGIGIDFHKKCGDRVKADEPLATLYLNSKTSATEACKDLNKMIHVKSQRKAVTPLILETL